MKNKKIIIIFVIIFIFVIIGGFFAIKYVKNQQQEENKIEEYTPEEEVADNQLRQTIVSLYFPSKDSKEIVPEARLVDIKEIINNPYEKLFNLLKNEKEEKIIPEGTRILKTYMEDDCLVLDLSEEFLNYNKNDEKSKNNLINSIVNTMTELTEVNKVKILVNGNQNEEFNQTYER